MESGNVLSFKSLTSNVGRFNLKGKSVLIPEMNRIGSHLLAATFRGFGVNAKVMDTCHGLDLGKEYTSGKECYPCQITMGDILYFTEKEKEKAGAGFNPEDYVYFMPEADGPCRFGMYNKFQRIVMDSIPGLDKLKIGSVTTEDGYSLAGVVDNKSVRDLKKVAFFSVVIGDILDRLLWRIRPYEKEPGMADGFIGKSMRVTEEAFERYGKAKDFDKIIDKIEEIIGQAKDIIDHKIPRKPLIGVVGEIYLRTHIHANQDTIRMLERYGAEVVNASITEWVNYISYDRLRDSRIEFGLNRKLFRLGPMKDSIKKMLGFKVELSYQELVQKRVYKRVKTMIDMAEDHRVEDLENILEEEDLFSFDIGTEACLSIPGILEYVRGGYNGVVNIYPFTCMPSTITSAIIKPLMNKLRVPYLDLAYDSSFQPGREGAIRTFMYQAHQHFERNGRKGMPD
jgi:predicted nucleotide-binding protein (sugar kinase/HSP70/actin superfamily)